MGTASIPVPDTSVSSVQHQYRYRTLRYVRFINTGTGPFGKFCRTSIPVPDISVSAIRHQYWYLRYRYGRLYRSWYRYRYSLTSIPVPNTWESSVKQNLVPGTSSVRYVHQNPVPPHCDIEIRLIVMRSDSELEIVTFRCDG